MLSSEPNVQRFSECADIRNNTSIFAVKKDIVVKDEIKTARECRTSNSLSLTRVEPEDTSLPVEQVREFIAVCCSLHERFSWQPLRSGRP